MKEWSDIPWVIVGAGRLGMLLGLLAEEVGVTVVAAWSRQRRPELAAVHRSAGPLDDVLEHIDGAVVWLTVVDDAISEVATCVAEQGASPRLVLHASGSLSSALLAEQGVTAPVGSLHPLLSVSDPHKAREHAFDATWTVEGDAEAIAFSRWFLGELGIAPVVIGTDDKSLYHASAVAASGLVTALMDVAFGLAEASGIESDVARTMLLALAKSTLANMESSPPADALTGPVARGDAATLVRHLEALERLGDDDTTDIYRLLSKRLAPQSLRREAGLNHDHRSRTSGVSDSENEG